MGSMMMMGAGPSGPGAAAFSPLDLSPALWLDATRGLYQERTGASATTPAASDGDPVGTWLDYSGNARHAVAISDAARPTLKLAIQNGEQVTRFDGTSDVMDTVSQVVLKHIFAVAKYAGAAFTAYAGLVSVGDGDNAHENAPFMGNSGLTTWYYNYGHRKNGEASSVGPMDAFAALAAFYSTGWTGSSGNNTIRVGEYRGGDRFWTGDIAEIVAFDAVLSDANRDLVEEYLMDKWGIT